MTRCRAVKYMLYGASAENAIKQWNSRRAIYMQPRSAHLAELCTSRRLFAHECVCIRRKIVICGEHFARGLQAFILRRGMRPVYGSERGICHCAPRDLRGSVQIVDLRSAASHIKNCSAQSRIIRPLFRWVLLHLHLEDRRMRTGDIARNSNKMSLPPLVTLRNSPTSRP